MTRRPGREDEEEGLRGGEGFLFVCTMEEYEVMQVVFSAAETRGGDREVRLLNLFDRAEDDAEEETEEERRRTFGTFKTD